MIKDKFDRTWNLKKNEVCPKCKQPDSCGNCNHKRLSNKDAKFLKNSFEKSRILRQDDARIDVVINMSFNKDTIIIGWNDHRSITKQLWKSNKKTIINAIETLIKE